MAEKCPMHREVVPGRRCGVSSCGTWLSSYNPDEVCSQHGGWKPRKIPERAPSQHRERAADFADLMGA